MIEEWIDDLCAVWAIDVNGFQTVRSVNLVRDSNFPESIDLTELADHPIALTFPPTLEPHYSAGAPKIAFWRGETEIHLCPDALKSRLPQILPWYQTVWQAAAAHVRLNGKVEYFTLPEEQDAIAIAMLKYGEEAIHWGIVIKWQVKERADSQITVSA